MGKILVTGGTGYLGTHMLVELVKQGYEPLCVDNLHNSNPSVLLAVKEICGKEIPFIKADAGDVAADARLVRRIPRSTRSSTSQATRP